MIGAESIGTQLWSVVTNSAKGFANVAFTGSLIVMFVLAGIVVLYSKRRPKDAYLSWGEAMASSVFCTFGLFRAFGVVPHQWLIYSGSELAMRSDAILAGPGSTGWFEWLPIRITKQTVADLVL